ncbi:GNAT family N-acetyltransferase [Desulfitobacterium sp. THU1]|uniref:GNAT family N-acetyltransferase n=1 Tax=Desulfitobacterium sp. THU1 TaxID=3138072 RepID=UPI00311FE13D
MLHLVEIELGMEEQFFEMARDFRLAGEARYSEVLEDGFAFASYIDALRSESCGQGLPQGHVPMTTLWLINDKNEICGLSRLRHYLVPHLEKEGGHIGYVVPPSKRRMGNGTMLLGSMLVSAREFGLDRVLVTCDSDNVPSARIIEKNGGILENEVVSDNSGKLVSRYWIKL